MHPGMRVRALQDLTVHRIAVLGKVALKTQALQKFRLRRALRNKKQIGQAARAVSRVRSTSMRNNSFTALLVGLLFISAAAVAVQVLRLSFATRDLRRLQPRIVEINANLNLAQALLNETLEYSKRNPAIDPLLQSLNLKTNSAAGASPQPISK